MLTVSAVTFLLPDPQHRLAGVRLRTDLGIAGHLLDFQRRDDGWELVIGKPPVHRMEYLLELRHADGTAEVVLDPGNPLGVEGAFGRKSVVEFCSYSAPGWLTAPAPAGRSDALELPVRSLDQPISVRTWSPADAPDEEPLPLLLAHDGPEYDALASLTRYLSAGVAGTWLPRLRAALLSPGPRDRWYSANPSYARALRLTVIPALTSRLATTRRVAMGASLGALAMLHAHARYPDVADALFLQSGSFLRPGPDDAERPFPYCRRIVKFVASVRRGALPGRPIPVVLTCGVAEQNLENNRMMTSALRAAGYPASLHELPDAHNYTAWRDALDPHLSDLLRQMSP
jgi:enterochelin esterase family protein